MSGSTRLQAGRINRLSTLEYPPYVGQRRVRKLYEPDGSSRCSSAQAVKRNLARFPSDFMFQLSAAECSDLKSQTVISNAGQGGRRTAPYAFNEQGVAMLS